MGKILGLAGKLQSGKDTLTNWVYAHVLTLPLIQVESESGEIVRFAPTPRAYVNENGKLMLGMNEHEDGDFDIDNRDPKVMGWLTNAVWYYFKHFSLAEPLKDICTNLYNLPVESVWGTSEDKNKPTYLLWEDFPKSFRGGRIGPMTGRQVMETVAKILRSINQDCFCNALKHNIEGYDSEHSLVKDIRFKNEIEMVQSMGGKVIRLTRTTEEAKDNQDISNIELDNYDKFDKIIDNNQQTLEETLAEFRDYLLEIGWLNIVEVK
jgi:hypothetical protein